MTRGTTSTTRGTTHGTGGLPGMIRRAVVARRLVPHSAAVTFESTADTPRVSVVESLGATVELEMARGVRDMMRGPFRPARAPRHRTHGIFDSAYGIFDSAYGIFDPRRVIRRT